MNGQLRSLMQPGPQWRHFAAAALCAWSFPATAAIIELKESVEVSSAVVQLGQVATIHDPDPAIAERLAAVTLFPAPPAGRTREFDFDAIRGRLTALGFNLADLEFSGSSLVTVSSGRGGAGSASTPSQALADLAQRRADELVTASIRQFLKEEAAALGNVQIELQLTPKQVSWISAAASARIEISGGSEPWTGQQTFRAGIFDRQGHRQEFQIACHVKPLPQVLVATANLPKGHIVRPDDVSWKQQPAGKAAATFVDREELVVGQETQRNLRAGEPIAMIDVRGVPLVRRGDIVTVVVKNQGITVRTDGKAMMDGGLGQAIKVLSLDGRRELSARVSGYHEVAVGSLPADDPAAQGNGTGVRLVTTTAADQRSAVTTAEGTVPAQGPATNRRLTRGGNSK
jgi:flagellar basal body P-ring formation protein FlgA